MNEWQTWIDILSSFILTLTLLALIWYAYETRLLRLATEAQTRQAIMPVLRVRANQDPDGLLLENLGTGLAVRMALQPLRFRDSQNNVLDCTFEPLFMIPAGNREAIDPVIELREAGSATAREKDPHRVLEVLKTALGVIGQLRLQLYVTDVMGRVYAMDVIWDYESDPAALVGLGSMEPRTTELLPAKDFPDEIRAFEIILPSSRSVPDP